MARAEQTRIRQNKDWTKGSILGNLWGLSWPMIITQGITTLGPTLDLIWVGRLGAASIAGVGIATMVVQVAGSVRTGLQTGTRALVARSVGAGNEAEANHVAQQYFIVTVAFGLIMAVIGIFLSRQILLLLGLKPDVVDAGAAYLRIQLIGMMTLSFQMMSQSLMQASGDARTPMKISLGASVLHVSLSPLLIFGLWLFPRLGVSGAALANVTAQGIAGVIGLWILYSGRTRLRLTMRNFRFDGKMTWRIVKIGIPVAISWVERTSANLLVMWFVVPFGTFAVAAHSLMDRVENLARMPAMGMGNAAGVLAGQNLGAGQPERAEKTGWLAIGLFTSIMSVISLALLLWPQYIVYLFNNEPELVETAVTFLRIQVIGFMVFGFIIVLMNCLNGVGDTWIPTINTLATVWLIQAPLAFWLPKNTALGVYGVRWAMVIAMVVRASVYAGYFKTGRWKNKKI
ncbi:MAG: MATE family efflux transporter [Chloroflexi bacterium]|nr:MATE family efflux transporter [Chloroflexota bacterium]